MRNYALQKRTTDKLAIALNETKKYADAVLEKMYKEIVLKERQ
ncbi:hypothetical protein [Clostridium sp.]